MSKSSHVQWQYREISIDPNILSTVFLGKQQYSINEEALVEEMRTLQEELMDKVRQIIDSGLTARQKEVMVKTYFEHRTQMEVADLLGVCQTTVHKIIAGNIDYSNGGKRYGGAIKKIKKICDEDADVKEILARLDEIRAELSAT